MGKIRIVSNMKKSFSYTNPNAKKPQSDCGKSDGIGENEESLKIGKDEARLDPPISTPPPPPSSFVGEDGKGNLRLDHKLSQSHIDSGVAVGSSKFIQELDYDEDDGEIFAKNLNGIILQYLEACGLSETYTTFYDECKSSGMLIPNHFRAELESGITLQDVETLLMHFDQENGEALLELWEVLTAMVDEGQHEVEKITFFIQVYIALIPFRLKMSDAKKASSMSKLREYFETQSEKCTMDKEMLALFALPFVPDPESHPVFGNLFQIAWIKKLRSRIKNLARSLCCPNKLVTREDTDLAKMFRICSNAVTHQIESTDGKQICIFSNVQPMKFTSGIKNSPSSPGRQCEDDFSPSLLFQRMNDLILENERYKSEESKYEKQCAQLLNVSLLLAQSLEEAAQGKEVNMEKLRHEVNQCLPVSLVGGNKDRSGNSSVGRQQRPQSSSGNTSDESEAFNQSPLFDVDVVQLQLETSQDNANGKNSKRKSNSNSGGGGR